MKKGKIYINKDEECRIEGNNLKLELSSRNEVVFYSPLGGSIQFASLIKSLGLVGRTVDLSIAFKEVQNNG